MCGPIVAVVIALERQRIDENRLGTKELNVERGRIGQRDIVRQGFGQAIIGAVAGGLVLLKIYWGKIKLLFSTKRATKPIEDRNLDKD